MSAGKLGKDPTGQARPYAYNGKTYDHIFHLEMYGKKTCRSFWSPGVTAESFARTVPIDYRLLKKRAFALGNVLSRAVSARITAPAGTDLVIGLRGRSAFSDDGDFSLGGSGGNLPAGEVYISPENNTAQGRIVYDGSISLDNGDIIINTPIACVLKDGFITDITGGKEAAALLAVVTKAEQNARLFEKTGQMPPGEGERNARNARAIGELGIGLNPEARVTGNMLEDEKAFHTCHFAIGANYDDDAPALIHLDGLVRQPTITAFMEDGEQVALLRNGEINGELL
jgi:leucyl aminopeptidase (aminopeptidase T)